MQRLWKSLVFVSAACAMVGAMAQGKVKPPPPIQGILVDATGKTIGPYYPGADGGWPMVLASISGSIVAFVVQTQAIGNTMPDVTKLAPWGITWVLFDGPGCTGGAYFTPTYNIPGARPSAVLAADQSGGGTIYLGSTSPPVATSLASYRDHVGTCFNALSLQTATPILEAVDLSSLFAAPFSIR